MAISPHNAARFKRVGGHTSLGRSLQKNPEAEAGQTPVVANTLLHRMLLAVILVSLTVLQRQRQLLTTYGVKRRAEDDEDDPERKRKQTRRCGERPDYDACGWALMLKETELLDDPTSKEAVIFRRRFRVPYPFFLELVKQIKHEKWEGFTTDKTEFGGLGTRRCIPVELKVLGRGNCFDDIPQMGGMSESTAQRSFHAFTRQFSRTFYSKCVPFPEGENLARIMKDYDDLRFPGAMGSTDVTHVHWSAAPHTFRCSYEGKEGYPTLAYQCTVDQSGRCLAATKWFAGAQNGKTIGRFDKFVQRVRLEYKDVECTLKDEDGNEYTVHGLYLLVDGGYHNVLSNCTLSNLAFMGFTNGTRYGRGGARPVPGCNPTNIPRV